MPTNVKALEARRRELVRLREKVEAAMLMLAPGDPRGPVLRGRLDDINEEIRRIDGLLALARAHAISAARTQTYARALSAVGATEAGDEVDALVDEVSKVLSQSASTWHDPLLDW